LLIITELDVICPICDPIGNQGQCPITYGNEPPTSMYAPPVHSINQPTTTMANPPLNQPPPTMHRTSSRGLARPAGMAAAAPRICNLIKLMHWIKVAALDMNESILDADQVENLIKFCPTKEKMELLKINKRPSCEPRGFGFVQFVAEEAKYHMDIQILMGQQMTVLFAEENRKKPSDMRLRERSFHQYMCMYVIAGVAADLA
ncbi:serine/arginine-rich SC35-like splicing factor SCL33, partial [Tanacetum coccineum]